MKNIIFALLLLLFVSSVALAGDVVWRNTQSGEVGIWTIDEDLAISATGNLTPTLPATPWQLVAVGDVRGTDKKDYARMVSLFLGGVTALSFSIAAGKLF